MKILFGIPDIMHRELVDLEITGIEKHISKCETIHYGPYYSKKRVINKIFNTITNAYRIRKKINRSEFDILFLNTAFDRNAIIRDFITMVFLLSIKTKVFLKFHGSDLIFLNNLTSWQKKMVEWIFKNVGAIGVLSKEEKVFFVKAGFPGGKIYVVKNPINPAIYQRDIKFKSKIGIPGSSFVFIFCGRFIPEKGLMDVINAFFKIQRGNQSVYLICIGDGPEMNKAKMFVKDNKITERVFFTGFIRESEIIPYYSNADALVFPTYHQEGFPMVVFQSLAASLPIITTRIRAAADYLTEPENVIWVKSQNIESVVEAMNTLLNNLELRTRMIKNNKILSQQFTTDNNAIEYISVFENILEN